MNRLTETHDLILLGIAILYIIIGFMRANSFAGMVMRGDEIPPGWLGIPIWIATIAIVVAVLW